MEKFLVDKGQRGLTLVEFIAGVCGVSKREAKRIVDSRAVFVNTQRVWIATHQLKVGDTVSVPRRQPRKVATLSRDAILFEDDSLVVIDKPAGLLSNGPASAEVLLQRLCRDRSVRAVHRIDRDTTGCLCFAKGERVWNLMVARFRERQVRKVYQVVVVGVFPESHRTISTPLDGKEAVSHITRVRGGNGVSVLEVEIETGRTHQIRKHLSGVGYPVLGDREYASKRSSSEQFRNVPRQLLHAALVEFPHPISEKKLSIRAPLPADFPVIR